MSSAERLAVLVLLGVLVLAVPVGLWRHGLLAPPLRADGAAAGEEVGAAGGGDGGGATAGASPSGMPGDGAPGDTGADAGGQGRPYGGAETEEDGGRLVVHVAGAVVRPGVYTLPAGARVVDAIRAAGGEGPDAASGALNLAARVVDGDRIWVPTRQEVERAEAAGPGTPPQGGTGPQAGGDGAGFPVDVNHASARELEAVPGIGPALAQRIVAHRLAHGPFSTVDELTEVPGIGPRTLEAMRGWLVAR